MDAECINQACLDLLAAGNRIELKMDLLKQDFRDVREEAGFLYHNSHAS